MADDGGPRNSTLEAFRVPTPVENGRGLVHSDSFAVDNPNTSKRYTLGTSSSDDDEDVAISNDRQDSDDDNSRPLPDAI